jgi:transcriptional regulator with XRE-family HTH domain
MLLYTINVNSESEKLGKNLKRIRIEKGISQGDIARELDVSRSFVSNIENGKTNPTLSTITKIAKAVGVLTGDLMK